MNTQLAPRALRTGPQSARKLLRAPRGKPAAEATEIEVIEGTEEELSPRKLRKQNLGREIYVFTHLQTKQVVYSLRSVLKNNYALKQIPFNGKKTVPRALRKDLWQPLAMIEFTPRTSLASYAGLNAFRMLREYRRLHETQWPLEVARDRETGQILSRKQRGRKLMDQKANSVADMAAVITSVTYVEPAKVSKKEAAAVDGAAAEEGGVAKAAPEKPSEPAADAKKEGETKGTESAAEASVVVDPNAVRATIKWANIYDAEFAAAWPATVVHAPWQILRNNRKNPSWIGEAEEVVAEGEPVEAAQGEKAAKPAEEAKVTV